MIGSDSDKGVTESLDEDMNPQLQPERISGDPSTQVGVTMTSPGEWSVLSPEVGSVLGGFEVRVLERAGDKARDTDKDQSCRAR